MENIQPNKTNASENETEVRIKKRTLIWGSLALVFIAAVFLWNPFSEKKNYEPSFLRDEPTQEQILQPGYEQRVKEMLDSGKTVGEISRETGIRKDVIRKIKNAHTKQE